LVAEQLKKDKEEELRKRIKKRLLATYPMTPNIY
jgi:hypothetical protein